MSGWGEGGEGGWGEGGGRERERERLINYMHLHGTKAQTERKLYHELYCISYIHILIVNYPTGLL